MDDQPKTNPKVDVTRCERCGADRGGVITREGERDRFLCFVCNKAEQQAGEGAQPK